MRKIYIFHIIIFTHIMVMNLAAQPTVPRIDSVVMLEHQPHEDNSHTIWYDDFDGSSKNYGESQGDLSTDVYFGENGKSMHSFYPQGSKGVGNRKVFFGDSPTGNPIVRRGEQFNEIYWRVYVKHQRGWTGGGSAKLSRATSLVTSNWAQAMIAHVWSSGETLTLDPASGVRGDEVVTTRYNDFDNLNWLGNKPTAEFPLFSTEESGRWVCVEARVKLNTPGKSDGENQLWIDGVFQTERTGLNWRGTYTDHGINAVFLESYWNQGSPVDQSRWIDNFVIATAPIGPIVSSLNPTLIKTPYEGNHESLGWEVEIATQNHEVVWKSNQDISGLHVQVDNEHGTFAAAEKEQLLPDRLYVVRIRELDEDGWSAWSDWHQTFRTKNQPARIGMWDVIR